MGKGNWSVEKSMLTVMRNQSYKSTAKPAFNKGSTLVNQEILSIALTTLAHIIKNDGDQYLPIFERLKNELDEYRRLQAVKELVIDMAEQDKKETKPHKNA